MDPVTEEKILELVFEDPDRARIIVDRLIPRMTYATPEEKDAPPGAVDYLRENHSRKPLAVVVDGSGEDPFLAAEEARMRQLFCQAGVPAYPSLPRPRRR